MESRIQHWFYVDCSLDSISSNRVVNSNHRQLLNKKVYYYLNPIGEVK